MELSFETLDPATFRAKAPKSPTFFKSASHEVLKEVLLPLKLDSSFPDKFLTNEISRHLSRLEIEDISLLCDCIQDIEQFKELVKDHNPAMTRTLQIEKYISQIKPFLLLIMERRAPEDNLKLVGGYRSLLIGLMECFLATRKIMENFRNLSRSNQQVTWNMWMKQKAGSTFKIPYQTPPPQPPYLTDDQKNLYYYQIAPTAELLSDIDDKLKLIKDLWDSVEISERGEKRKSETMEALSSSEIGRFYDLHVNEIYYLSKEILSPEVDPDAKYDEIDRNNQMNYNSNNNNNSNVNNNGNNNNESSLFNDESNDFLYNNSNQYFSNPNLNNNNNNENIQQNNNKKITTKYTFKAFKPLSEIYSYHPDQNPATIKGKYHFGYEYTKSLIEYSKKLKVVFCSVGKVHNWKELTYLNRISFAAFYSSAPHYFMYPRRASLFYENIRSKLTFQVQREVWNLLEDPVIEFFATSLGLNPRPLSIPTDADVSIVTTIQPLENVKEIHFFSPPIVLPEHALDLSFFSAFENDEIFNYSHKNNDNDNEDLQSDENNHVLKDIDVNEKKWVIKCRYLSTKSHTLSPSLTPILRNHTEIISSTVNKLKEYLPVYDQSKEKAISSFSEFFTSVKNNSIKTYNQLGDYMKKKPVEKSDNEQLEKQLEIELKTLNCASHSTPDEVDLNNLPTAEKLPSYNDLNSMEDPIETETVYDDTHIDLRELEKEFEAKKQELNLLLSHSNDNLLFSDSVPITLHEHDHQTTPNNNGKTEAEYDINSIIKSDDDLEEDRPVLVLHIHGGGWISQSPKTHLSYLYSWAVQSEIPILSIDYSLSPEAPFPTALNECFALYKWLLVKENAQSLGLSDVPRIILAGDSAGANLCCSTSIRIIKENLPRPIGLLLHYPVMFLSKSASIGRLIFNQDPILNYQSLKIVLESYLGDNEQFSLNNPFISPGVVSDAILSQFPRTVIMVGDVDPLIDDSTFLFERLRNVGVHCFLEVFRHLPHGYLNLPSQLPTAPIAIKDAANYIKWFVEESNKEI